MGWPFHQSSSKGKKNTTPAQAPLTIASTPAGITFVATIQPEQSWLLNSADFGSQAELVMLLCQLEEEGYLQWGRNVLTLSWPDLYDLINDPVYHESLYLLQLPEIIAWRPVLSSNESLSDYNFSIILAGWINEHGEPVRGSVELTGAQVTWNHNKFILPQDAWKTVSAISNFHQRNSASRDMASNKIAWAAIRRSAIRAQADLTDFLKKTIVLTPKRLNIGLRKEQFGESKTIEITPNFDEAPPRWLELFDQFPDAQKQYEIPSSEGLVHVILPPEVHTVLKEIKKMPGRRVAGERAEAFIRNPFATLGPDAEKSIDPELFEQAREDAGIVFSRFVARIKHDVNHIPIHVVLLVEESRNGKIRSNEIPFDSSAELQKFINKLEGKIATQAQCCFWDGFELEILGDTPAQLLILKEALLDWQYPKKISAKEVLDLSHYSNRIQDIGIEKPFYSAFIARKSEDGGWFPDNVVFGVFYTPEGEKEPVSLSFDESMINDFKEKLRKAKDEENESFSFPGCPHSIKINDGETIAATFNDISHDVKNGRFNPDKGQKEQKKKTSLLIKPNVDKLDYTEQKGNLSLPPGLKPKIPRSLKKSIQLKEHQINGLVWLQYLWKKSPIDCRGALLADDMGLGKTLQLLSMIAACLEENPSLEPFLVVAPVSLLENWRQEIEKFFLPDSMPLLTLYGQTLASKRLPREAVARELAQMGITRLLQKDWLGQAKVVLTTYETLRDLEFSLAAQKWSAMICDEAQKIKNPNAMVTRAAKKQNARLKIACTGTPVENTLTDLWCLFDFAQPGLLGALNDFGTQYRRPIEAENDAEKEQVEKLRAIIAPQIMRRTKAEVAKDLPRKIIVNECRNLPMSERQRALYANAISQFQQRETNMAPRSGLQSPLGLLQYLRRLCSDPRPIGLIATEADLTKDVEKNSPKMAWLLNRLGQIREKSDKVIVFCEFRDLQRVLKKAIYERFKINADIVNGSTSTNARNALNRQKLIKAFQENDGFGIIILSPLAVGFGVNIQAANHVIHFTRPWNPAKEDQATDRAYRIGQTKDVFVYYPVVVAHDFLSFDAKLDQLLERKRALSQDMLNGAGDIKPDEFGDLENVDGGNAFGNDLIQPGDISSMSPDYFEIFCAALWQAHGYNMVYKTPKSGDGGIDVVAIKRNKVGALIQCKSSSVIGQELGWESVKDVVAGTAAYTIKHPGVVFSKVAVTNQFFNGMAKVQAQLNHVQLVDQKGLVDMVNKKSVMRKELLLFH